MMPRKKKPSQVADLIAESNKNRAQRIAKGLRFPLPTPENAERVFAPALSLVYRAAVGAGMKHPVIVVLEIDDEVDLFPCVGVGGRAPKGYYGIFHSRLNRWFTMPTPQEVPSC